jgi:high-affinity iron transporter
MLQSLLVTFREGLESLLIVGVISAYLRKTGRTDLLRGVRVGLALSILTCIGGAWLWQMVPNQPLYEGIAALTAAALVGALLAQMLRMGRRMKSEIEAKVARATRASTSAPGAVATSAPSTLAAGAGVALVTALLITREGLEAVLYLGIQARMAGDAPASLIGAGAGLLLAGAAAWVWFRYAHRLNLGVVLKITAVFLALFLVQLLIFGIHELAESGVIEGSQGFHDATEAMGPQGPIGHVLTYSLLAAPLLYLLWNRRGGGAGPRPRAPA